MTARRTLIANVSIKLRRPHRLPPFISHIQDKQCVLMQHAAGRQRTALQLKVKGYSGTPVSQSQLVIIIMESHICHRRTIEHTETRKHYNYTTLAVRLHTNFIHHRIMPAKLYKQSIDTKLKHKICWITQQKKKNNAAEQSG